MMEVTPRMLKVAWAAFRGDRTGPLIGSSGPAFREAIEAALAECDEIERLRAREARLREALEKIAENEWVGGIGEAELYEGWREVAKKRGDIARAALGKEKSDVQG